MHMVTEVGADDECIKCRQALGCKRGNLFAAALENPWAAWKGEDIGKPGI